MMIRPSLLLCFIIIATLGLTEVESFAPGGQTLLLRRQINAKSCDWRPHTLSLDANSADDEDLSSAEIEDDNDGVGIIEAIRRWFRSEEGQEDIQTYLFSLGLALVLRLLIIEPRYIPSLSMYPTFDVGDQLAVEKVTKRVRPPRKNEVVVFNPPQAFRQVVEGQFGADATSKKSSEALIKRIVAVEGDVVAVSGGNLFVNGVKQDEPFTAEDAQYEFGPVTVPEGNVLVLGDNRNHSLDGHIWGFLPKRNVIGRAVFIYWPPWRIGNNGMY